MKDTNEEMIELHGKRFHTITFPDLDAANLYMDAHDEWGVLHMNDDGKVFIAKMNDKGVPINPAEKMAKKAKQKRSEPIPSTIDLPNLERDLERVEKKLRSLDQADKHLINLSSHIHLGRVGGSGRNTARLNKRREADLERTIKNAKLSIKLQGERNSLLIRIERAKAMLP